MKINLLEFLTNSVISVVSILKTSVFQFVIMNMIYWNFGDFIKSFSFRTINTLDISNTDVEKAKMSRLEIVTVSS